ncbi:lysophospholipid acyltransferase family protein [Knoellia subterranea]|uniref:1-acyl-sn-glycerol-3-phosphate acyltransferase n=1 Tax=Knoellia subterranea KCTC 19937 TaxID=1385521 RepID=A0A0A0JRF6_9MICO|nr:lysophospholipid acyltransferase family protein [Knoellia subterranea]KGN38627.1 1-acyl-sn-glycerol-3-phosphate acyltransferase [Knoellia subterranea KCTC 19937]
MTGSPPAAWRAALGRHIGRTLVTSLYAARSHGVENVPLSGPVIFAANHTGYLDGAVVFGLAPRPAHFLVLASTFELGVGPLLHLTGQIPLQQDRGDRTALSSALGVLQRGGAVGIFPEGGRGRGDLEKAGKGVAWLALQGHAPVVPVACLGTRATGELASSWPRLRSRLVVDFGEPISVTRANGIPGRVRLERAAEEIRVALADHVARASAHHGIELPTDVPPDLWD